MALTELLIIGTFNNLHENHKTYTYDKIFEHLNNFNGDLLALEMCTDDIMQKAINKDKYTNEILKIKNIYKNLFQLCGIISKNNEKDEILKLEDEFKKDNRLNKEKQLLKELERAKEKLALNLNITEAHNGKYDLFTEVYNEQRKLLLKETKYFPLIDYYENELSNINKNIIKIIEENKGKKIAIVTSMEKRSSIFKAIQNYFGNKILIRRV